MTVPVVKPYLGSGLAERYNATLCTFH